MCGQTHRRRKGNEYERQPGTGGAGRHFDRAVSVMAVHAQEAKTPPAYLIAETEVTDRAAFSDIRRKGSGNAGAFQGSFHYVVRGGKTQRSRANHRRASWCSPSTASRKLLPDITRLTGSPLPAIPASWPANTENLWRNSVYMFCTNSLRSPQRWRILAFAVSVTYRTHETISAKIHQDCHSIHRCGRLPAIWSARSPEICGTVQWR
jgi:hypothetical protein